MREIRRREFDNILESGFENGMTLNEHAYNSLFKSGRKDIMPKDIIDALRTDPIPADSGSVEYINSKTGTSVFVNQTTKKIVGVWPIKFKRKGD